MRTSKFGITQKVLLHHLTEPFNITDIVICKGKFCYHIENDVHGKYYVSEHELLEAESHGRDF